MTNSKHLHQEAEKLRQKIRAKLEEADKATMRADSYNKNGKHDQALREDELADRYFKEVIVMENSATGYEQQAEKLEAKAASLDREESALRISIESQINRIEQQKRILRGDY